MSEQRKLTVAQVKFVNDARALLHVAGLHGVVWSKAYNMLGDMTYHGTSDGKPYVEPIRIPTDEDAKSRPMVMVRDREGDEWTDEMVLLRVQGEGDYPFVAEETGFEECEVTKWKYCRFPTEAESKEAGQ